MLIANDIHKSYGSLPVLKGINVNIKPGLITALMGRSGAGKSTLLQILGTLDSFDKGELLFDGISLTSRNQKELSLFRNLNLGFIFQFHNLLSEFSALENVCIPALIKGESKAKVAPRAKELLSYLGLGDRINHKSKQLSGGEQQRVAVARALINNPKLILADEPTGNLDSHNSIQVFELIQKLSKEKNIAFLIATHNEKLAALSDELVIIEDGKIVVDKP